MNTKDIYDFIGVYFDSRQLKVPTLSESLLWLTTEVGEVADAALSMEDKWARNNPDSHPFTSSEDVADELGDIIFMAIVAGRTINKNPLHNMLNKMNRKMKTLKDD